MTKEKIKFYVSVLLGKHETEHYNESREDFWLATKIQVILIITLNGLYYLLKYLGIER